MGSGRMPAILKAIFCLTLRFAGSMMLTVPPTSEETHSSEPSSLNVAKRGRASTSTLATTLRVAVSMKCAMFVVSDVFTRILPSGLIPMPSGSTVVVANCNENEFLILGVGNPARPLADFNCLYHLPFARIDNRERIVLLVRDVGSECTCWADHRHGEPRGEESSRQRCPAAKAI
jgi:hypothetical protein